MNGVTFEGLFLSIHDRNFNFFFFLVIINGFMQQAANKEKEYTFLPCSCGRQLPCRHAQALSHRPYAPQATINIAQHKVINLLKALYFLCALCLFLSFVNLEYGLHN